MYAYPDLQVDKENNLGILVTGKKAQLFINNIKVNEVAIDTLPGRSVTLVYNARPGGPFVIEFDNFILRMPVTESPPLEPAP